MKCYRLWVMTLLCCLATSSYAIELVEWHKKPIAVVLSVGEERIIQFPENVKVGFPASIRPLLRHQSVGGAVYWLANTAFEEKRVKVQGLESGRIFYIDLRAVEQKGFTEKMRILLPNTGESTAKKTAKTPSNKQSSSSDVSNTPSVVPQTQIVSPKLLTQFAAQQLYAPARLVKDVPSIQRVSIKGWPTLDLYRGGAILATPLVSWFGGYWTITAVKLENKSPHRIDLDPRNLRGKWSYATFQHTVLTATGTLEDTTTVYLISEQPYHDAIYPYGKPIEPPVAEKPAKISLSYED